MDTYVGNVLEERFTSRNTRGKKKHVIDLALETYLKENNVDETSRLDPKFKDAALRNIKIFIFAGHDTSSSTICYCHYQLSKHPTALARLRKECEDVFGMDVDKTGDMIKADPYLLNKMKYGDAVIRETLRIHPPGNTVRAGAEEYVIPIESALRFTYISLASSSPIPRLANVILQMAGSSMLTTSATWSTPPSGAQMSTPSIPNAGSPTHPKQTQQIVKPLWPSPKVPVTALAKN
jgi:hypothetical protein